MTYLWPSSSAAAAPRGQLAIRLQHAENRAEHLFEEVLSECRFKEPKKELVKITLLMSRGIMDSWGIKW